jgi:hypothetical protein
MMLYDLKDADFSTRKLQSGWDSSKQVTFPVSSDTIEISAQSG